MVRIGGGRPGKLAELGFAPGAEWALGREGLKGGQTLNLGGALGAVPPALRRVAGATFPGRAGWRVGAC